MNVVVTIPAFNEASTIGDIIRNIPRDFANVKVLVINDGSTDKTFDVAKETGADRIITHAKNKGLGVAFKTGIEMALQMEADIIVNIDADGQFNPSDIPKLVRPITEGLADMVTCTRFKNNTPDMPWIKKFGNKKFTKLINSITGQRFTDTQCGFRAYSREAALRMNLFGKHTYTQEVFLDLAEKGMRIKEIPLEVKGQREGKSRVVGSIFSYILKTFLIILRTVRDHRPLSFFGGIGIVIFLLGFSSGLFVFINWLLTGRTMPYQSLILFSVLFIVLSFLLLILALIADMLDRHRKMQEEILYEARKRRYSE